MFSVSYEEFKRHVAMRERSKAKEEEYTGDPGDKVLRSDQRIWSRNENKKRLATCPECDEVVDEKILHSITGLCPICHEEQIRR